MHHFIDMSTNTTIYHWTRQRISFWNKSVTFFFQLIFFLFSLKLLPAKIKQLKSPEFANDLDLHFNPSVKLNEDFVGFRVPSYMDLIVKKSKEKFLFPPIVDSNDFEWLSDDALRRSSDNQVKKVTNYLMQLFKNRRMKIFQENSRTRSPLYSRETGRLWRNPASLGKFFFS